MPAPLYSVWFDRFGSSNPNVTIAYDPAGSIAGISAITSAGASFGATDTAMTDAELKAAPGKILHVPVALGSIAVVVNLPDVDAVQLDGPTLAGIFLGRIATWRDPAIAALNQGVTLPSLPITVVHRSDPSGTTSAFTAYLDSTSTDWHAGPATGRSVTWPAGTGVAGDGGVADAVKATQGAIGYAASTFGAAAGLRTAKVRNAAGNFVRATTLGMATAGEAAVAALPADLRQGPLVNEPGVNAYPIVVFADILIAAEQPGANAPAALVALLGWCLTTVQTDAAQQGYAALPGAVQVRALASLRAVTSSGHVVWP